MVNGTSISKLYCRFYESNTEGTNFRIMCVCFMFLQCECFVKSLRWPCAAGGAISLQQTFWMLTVSYLCIKLHQQTDVPGKTQTVTFSFLEPLRWLTHESVCNIWAGTNGIRGQKNLHNLLRLSVRSDSSKYQSATDWLHLCTAVCAIWPITHCMCVLIWSLYETLVSVSGPE